MIGATRYGRRRGRAAVDVVAQDVREQLEDAADHVLLLARERATRAVGDRRHAIGDRVEIDRARIRTADLVEEAGQREAVALARRALTARLDREEAGDPVRDRGEVVAVVEEHEAGGAESAARVAHRFVGDGRVERGSPGGTDWPRR